MTTRGSKAFTIYDEGDVFFYGGISGGRLHLVSEIDGEYYSERHYLFSKEETVKLFALISPEDFIGLCREKRLLGMEEFLEQNGITYSTSGF